MSFFFSNSTIWATAQIYAEIFMAFVGLSISTLYFFASNAIETTWEHLLPWFHKFLEFANMTYGDFAMACVLVYSTYRLIYFLKTQYVKLTFFVGFIYFFWFGREVVPAFMVSGSHDFAKGSSVKPNDSTLKLESAFSTGEVFIKEEDGLPKGVFLVLGKRDDEYVVVGHGFVVDSRLYTARHVVVDSMSNGVTEFLAFVPGKKALKVNVPEDKGDEYFDIIELYGMGVPAALGLKSLKANTYRKGKNLTVYTLKERKVNNMVYNAQYLPDQKIVVEVGDDVFSHYLCTKSNTNAADSGLPVMQGNYVVAIHTGSYPDREVNVHSMLIPLLRKEYKKLASSYQSVRKAILVETPFSTDHGEESERALAIEFEERMHNEKLRRMRGEHIDEQGYRENAKNSKPGLTQEEDEDVEQEFINRHNAWRGRKGKGGRIQYESEKMKASVEPKEEAGPQDDPLKDKAPGAGAQTSTLPNKELETSSIASDDSEDSATVKENPQGKTQTSSSSSKKKRSHKKGKKSKSSTQGH